MGSPAFYFWPESAGYLVKVGLGGVCTSFTNIVPDPVVESVVGVSRMGWQTRHILSNQTRIRVVLRRFNGRSTAGALAVQRLELLREHLRRGGIVCVTNNDSKAWCAFVTNALRQRETELLCTAETFGGALETGQQPIADDEIVIQSSYPQVKRERHTVSSYNAAVGKITVSNANGLNFNHLAGPVLAHHRDFYVAMRLAPDFSGPVIDDEGTGRRQYTLDVTLQQDGLVLENLAGQAGSVGGWSSETVIGALDLAPDTKLSNGGNTLIYGGL